MNVSQLPFQVLQYFGVWRPKSWTSPRNILMYNFYSFFMINIFLTYMTSFFLYGTLTRSKNSRTVISEDLFLFVDMFGIGSKILNIFVYRKDIIDFENMLHKTICCPRNIRESDIKKQFDNENRSNTILFLSVGYVASIIYFIMVTFLMEKSTISLPFKMWIPFEIDSQLKFWFIYCYEVAIALVLVSIRISVDCCVIGMIQEICAQLEIIKYRFHNVDDERKENYEKIKGHSIELKSIKNCMHHHSYMYLVGAKLRNILSLMVFQQFFLTILLLGAVLYQLSISGVNNFKFWTSITACSNFLFEIFLFCYYGEQMMEKSRGVADAVYETDWTNLTLASRKYLILIIMRASKPIELNGISLVTMSFQTFLKILKVSYTTFNLLETP